MGQPRRYPVYLKNCIACGNGFFPLNRKRIQRFYKKMTCGNDECVRLLSNVLHRPPLFNGSCKGRPAWNRGRSPYVVTSDTRKKLSKIHKGTLNPMWRGGTRDLITKIRDTRKMEIWRMRVRKKYGARCQNQYCDGLTHVLNIHHKKPIVEIISENNISTVEESFWCPKLWDVDNGQVLCFNCHLATKTYLNPRST